MGRAILATMSSDKRAALIDKYGPQDAIKLLTSQSTYEIATC